MRDFYKVMGELEPTATTEQIKVMYRALSKKYHADRNVDTPELAKWSHETMTELNLAYEVLKEPEKRAAYNRQQGYPPPPQSVSERQEREQRERERQEREREQKLASLYARAVQLCGQKQWAEAIVVFGEIVAIAPTYRDTPTRLQEARQALEEQQRAAKLAQLYREAAEHLRLEQWQLAINAYEAIRKIDLYYKDVVDKLRQARAGKHLADLYAEAEAFFRQEKWADAIIRYENILVEAPRYENVAERLTVARKNQFEVELRTRAVELLEQGEYAEAERVVGQIRQWRGETLPVRRPGAGLPAAARRVFERGAPWGWVAGSLVGLFLLITGLNALGGGGSATPTIMPYATQLPVINTATPTSTPQATVLAPPEPTLGATRETGAPALGATRTRERDGMVQVYVPAGEFQMGSETDDSDEQPVHTVALDGFWLDRTEVTNAQYQKCVTAGTCAASDYANDNRYNGATQPVVGVSWHDAVAYCEWAGGWLPTEAEWEYAARGPEELVYPWGNDWREKVANCSESYCKDGYKYAAPVGSFPQGASWVGALDLAGNVWEWVADWYGAYPSGRQVNPTGPVSGDYKGVRGGSWYDNRYYARGAYRSNHYPDLRDSHLGFRCGG